MRKITVLDFANQIGILSDEVPVAVKTDIVYANFSSGMTNWPPAERKSS